MSRLLSGTLVTSMASSALVACYMGIGAGADTTPPQPTVYAPTGLPCDVAQALQPCSSCHSNPPVNGALMALTSDVDLKRASSDPKLTVAEACVNRMQDTIKPMPPGGFGPTQSADVATLKGWIAAGYPTGSCGNGGQWVSPTTCSSGRFTSRDEGQTMQPGGACTNCHASSGGEGPIYTFAGTVFSTYHEQNGCVAAPAILDAVVVITDADGVDHALPVNQVGNFFSRQTWPTPYHARVERGGKVHAMQSAQTNGDCNLCHTEQGNGGAPGRITAP